MTRQNTPYDAQDGNVALERAIGMLRTCANLLEVQADKLRERPTRYERVALKRVLSGVLADVETVRIAIRD